MMIDTSPWSSCSCKSHWLPCFGHTISSTGPSVSPFRDFCNIITILWWQNHTSRVHKTFQVICTGGRLKSTRNSYSNTGSFPRNHIWMCGVLKKSIFAYLKFHICIPKISASPCVSSDQKNQNIRHSWIRLWIRTRALSQTNTGVNFQILTKNILSKQLFDCSLLQHI